MADEVEIDGVSMRTEAYNISTSTGRATMPARRGEDLVMAGRSGYEFVPGRPYEPGYGALAIWAVGRVASTGAFPATHELRQAELRTNIAKIQRFFTRNHRLSTIRARQPDGTWRRARVQWTEWEEPQIQAGFTRAEWGIGFTIPDVWWEDESTSTNSSTANSTLPKTLSLTNFAGMTGVIEDAIITVVGPITNPRVTDDETGAWVQFTGNIATGQTWVVDVGNWTSTANGVSGLATTTHSAPLGGYRFLVIPNEYQLTDTPRLTLTGSGAGAGTYFNVLARRKWASG